MNTLKNGFCQVVFVTLLSIVTTTSVQDTISSKTFPITTLINAKWFQTPLYLEIAEFLSEENSALFWDFLKDINDLDKPLTDYETESQQYNKVMNLVNTKLSAVQIPLLKLVVSMHSLTPRIQTHLQISNRLKLKNGCKEKIFVQIGSQVLCNTENIAEIINDPSNKLFDDVIETYSFDHVYPSSENRTRTVVLYGDLGTKEFALLNEMLTKEASDGRIRYITRHYINKLNKKNVRLSGYGVELHLKSTEYKSQDDAPKSFDEANENIVGDEADELEIQGFNFKILKARFPSLKRPLEQMRHHLMQDSEEIPQLKAWEFQDLGLQAAVAIAGVKGDESLQILQFTAHNFPMQSRMLLTQNIPQSFREEIKHNIEVFGRSLNIVPPDGALFINGLFFDADSMDVNALIESVRHEVRVLESLYFNKVQGALATSLLGLDFTNSKNKDFAIDIRDTAINWINDIEKDPPYRRWPNSVMDLLRPTFPGMLRNVRKNLFNLVLVVDPLSPKSRNLIKMGESFVHHMAPVRLGIIFDLRNSKQGISDVDYDAIVCAFNFITQKKDSKAALHFFTELYTIVGDSESITRKKIKKQLQKTFDRLSSKYLDEVLDADSDYDYGKQLAKEFIDRLGFVQSPQALLNGVPMPQALFISENDFEEAIFGEIIQQTSVFQKAVYRGDLTDSDEVIDYLMNAPHVMPRLNQRILGNEQDKKMLDLTGRAEVDISNVALLSKLSNRDMTACLMKNIKYFVGKHSTENYGEIKLHFLTVWVVGDLDQKESRDMLLSALRYLKTGSSFRVAFIPNVENNSNVNKKDNINKLVWAASQTLPGLEATNLVLKWLSNYTNIIDIPSELDDILSSVELHLKMLRVYSQKVLGVTKSERLIVANGNIYGPFRPEEYFGIEDFGLIDRYHSLQYGDKIRTVLKKTIKSDENVKISLNSDTLMKLYSVLISRPSKTRFKMPDDLKEEHSVIQLPPKNSTEPYFEITAVVDPASRNAQKLSPILILLRKILNCQLNLYLTPLFQHSDMPVKNFYRYVIEPEIRFDYTGNLADGPHAKFTGIPLNPLLTQNLQVPENWLVEAVRSVYDLDNIKLGEIGGPVHSEFDLEYLLLEGHCFDATSGAPPRGLQITLGTQEEPLKVDTIVMANLGYFQLKANPGIWQLRLREGKSADIYDITNAEGPNTIQHNQTINVVISSLRSHVIKLRVSKKPTMQSADLLGEDDEASVGIWSSIASSFGGSSGNSNTNDDNEVINIFSVASGHLYERLLRIMMLSVIKHTKSEVKFWFLKNYLSPQFTDFLPYMAQEYGFKYELVQYKWPRWLHQQTEKQRTIWGYKILFLDVLFPLSVRKIIFVDADAIVRTDIKELYEMDLGGAPYAYTPFCDSRKEMEGFRFWKQGYWKSHLMGRRYHISALYVVDLKRFRKIAAGDRLRGQYQALSQDPNSLSNLDQDLPNNMIHQVAIKSLPDDWLWCQTWCSDNSLKSAKVIDLCNNPLTKEAKLTAAQRIVPEWKDYDAEIKVLMGKIEDHENHEVGSVPTLSAEFNSPQEPDRKKSIHNEL